MKNKPEWSHLGCMVMVTATIRLTYTSACTGETVHKTYTGYDIATTSADCNSNSASLTLAESQASAQATNNASGQMVMMESMNPCLPRLDVGPEPVVSTGEPDVNVPVPEPTPDTP